MEIPQWPMIHIRDGWEHDLFPTALDLSHCEASTLKRRRGPRCGIDFRVTGDGTLHSSVLSRRNPDTLRPYSTARFSEVVRTDAAQYGDIVFKIVIMTTADMDENDRCGMEGTNNEALIMRSVFGPLYNSGMLPFVTAPLATSAGVWKRLVVSDTQTGLGSNGTVDDWVAGFVVANHLFDTKQFLDGTLSYRVMAMPTVSAFVQRLFSDYLPSMDTTSDTLYRFVMASYVESVDIEAVLMQIFFALQVFWEFRYVHWDLHANNVLITRLHKPKRIVLYLGSDGEALVVVTHYIVTIIDCELSSKFRAPQAIIDLAAETMPGMVASLEAEIVNRYNRKPTALSGSLQAIGIVHDRFRQGVDLFTLLGGMGDVLCHHIPSLFEVVSPDGTFPGRFRLGGDSSFDYWIPVEPPLSSPKNLHRICKPCALSEETIRRPIDLLHSDLFVQYRTQWSGGPFCCMEPEGIRTALPSAVLGFRSKTTAGDVLNKYDINKHTCISNIKDKQNDT
jgi:hypothetical protein